MEQRSEMEPPPPPPPPALIDDLIGEILLRFPPDDPACLVRASVVCKPWGRLLSDRAFLRRYRKRHGAPPLLGFLCNHYRHGRFSPCFVPTTKAFLSIQPDPNGYILDCRHGRVLRYGGVGIGLVVWEPISNDKQELPRPVNQLKEEAGIEYQMYTAAVLCAVDGCDHLDCRGGAFLVVWVGIDDDGGGEHGGDDLWAMVYSSETGTWSGGVSSVHLDPTMDDGDFTGKESRSSLLAGDALYFGVNEGQSILKYSMVGGDLSLMQPPPLPVGNMVLVKAEGGGLGASGVEGYSLHLWSWQTGPGGVSEWEQRRVIELDGMLPMAIGDPSTKLDVVDFAEGFGSVFVSANDGGIFAVELKSGRVREIGKGRDWVRKMGNGWHTESIFPFMSFYTPDHARIRLQAPVNGDGVINQET